MAKQKKAPEKEPEKLPELVLKTDLLNRLYKQEAELTQQLIATRGAIEAVKMVKE